MSFGFSPFNMEKVDFGVTGGAAIFQDRGQIEWTINGRGRGFRQVGIDHVLNVESDSPDSVGHRIYASMTYPLMDQPGRVYIQTDDFEPCSIKT